MMKERKQNDEKEEAEQWKRRSRMTKMEAEQ